ncbi:hypothetical protein PTKIN_Ptkin09bG0239600 [Pterospermum kingtungense]
MAAKGFSEASSSALLNAGVVTFRDDNELPRGQDISSELLKAIEETKISVVVFSKNYASSRWCLEELIGSFAESFAKHEERFKDQKERIEKWREALTVGGNLSGYDLRSMSNGYESRFIQKIVKDVLGKLNRNIHNGLHVATLPVALESRVKRMVRPPSPKLCTTWFVKNIKIDNVDRGINLIKERLCCRRVFIALDDLDESTQCRALVADRKWFGPGSRILVATRDEHLLTELEVDERYKVERLNNEESIELLSLYAFRRPAPEEDYLQLSNSLVEHAQRLPLALEILGSFLFKRSQREWENFVEKLQKVPHHQVHKKLRISTYDTLDDDFLKAMFLDIACFYIGMDKDYVITILDGCGFFPKIGFQVLLERSLIEIGPHNQKLQMHDLLRDMGREIVREESLSHPGYRSRLWFHQDVVDVLTKHMGIESVEGLSLDVPALKDVVVSTEAFAKMINLRLLKINSAHFTGSYEKISKELRWFCWRECPLAVLPPNLHLDNLVVLDMRFSSVKKVWRETKSRLRLKILDLSYSVHLGETPNFARLSSLERLELKGCTGLVECCSKLSNLPEHLSKMEALRKLIVSGSAITELPNSIALLKKLEDLSLYRLGEELPSESCFSFFSSCTSPKTNVSSSLLLPESFHHLSSLKNLDLSECNLSDNEISLDFGSFHLLRSLNLGGNKFCNLPAGISCHPSIKILVLNNCRNLRSLTELPKNLWSVEAKQCTSIERYPNLSNLDSVRFIRFSNSQETNEIQWWDFRSFHGSAAYSWSEIDPSQPKKWFTSKWRCFEAYFPAREVPDWFEYKEVGSSVSFFMPSILLYLQYISRIKQRDVRLLIGQTTLYLDGNFCKDHAWVSYMTPHILIKDIRAEEGDEIEVSFERLGGILVNKCGIYLPIRERVPNWNL